MNWKNFLSSGYIFSDNENELATRYKIINIVLLILSMILILILLVYVFIDDTKGVIIYSSALLLGVFSLYILRQVGKDNYKISIYIINLGYFVILLLGHLHEPGEHPLVAWAIIQMFICFFILDIKLSMIISVWYVFAVVWLAIYTADNVIKYILKQLLPIGFVVIMLKILDKKIIEGMIKLDKTNKNLETTINERTMKIEEEKRKLYTQANYDCLTGLPNRNNFYRTIRNWIDNDKDRNLKFALFFIDIDRFKRVNDSFGHPIGDSVLKVVSARLNSISNDKNFLYRISGDEFILLLKYNDEKEIDIASYKVQNIIKPAIVLKKHTLYISVSIGISLYPCDTVNYDDLIRYSDTSMFKSKKEGIGLCTRYSQGMARKIQQNVILETQLYNALDKHEFKVFYQPQVDTSNNNNIVGLEALVRWISPELGMKSPDSFLPLSEVTGFIVLIDYYVLREGMKQIVEWKKNNFNVPRISFNISSRHLKEKIFIEKLKNLLHETSCRAEWIELEITESHVMEDLDEAIDILISLRKLGLTVAIDDFGTGYTSLAYLEKLPIDKLKIDKLFVTDIDKKKINQSIVKAIIDIGKSMGLKIIAEGVETSKEKTYLLDIGCHLIQGYLYYKPMPAEEIIKELKRIKDDTF